MTELNTLAQRLASRGYRLTPPRLKVLSAVLSQKEHFTVEDIYRQVPRVGRATVFRAMKLLLDLGVVCRVLLEDGSLHYRLSHNGHHHHLVCSSCGRVQDLDLCTVSDLVGELSQRTGFAVDGHWLEFYGRCSACRQTAATVAAL